MLKKPDKLKTAGISRQLPLRLFQLLDHQRQLGPALHCRIEFCGCLRLLFHQRLNLGEVAAGGGDFLFKPFMLFFQSGDSVFDAVPFQLIFIR